MRSSPASGGGSPFAARLGREILVQRQQLQRVIGAVGRFVVLPSGDSGLRDAGATRDVHLRKPKGTKGPDQFACREHAPSYAQAHRNAICPVELFTRAYSGHEAARAGEPTRRGRGGVFSGWPEQCIVRASRARCTSSARTRWTAQRDRRPSASRSYFGISIDALYSDRAATDEANRLWPAEANQAPPPAPAPAFPWPLAPYITPEQWAELSEPLRHAAALGAAEGLRKARDLLPSSEKRQANDK